MSSKSLIELYAGHTGKVSDKWSLYLREYDRLLGEYREQAVRLLEIGIQNGGSLEIWSRYFRNAVALIGCDINPDCARLSYDDPRIGVILGDANDPAVHQTLLQRSPEFDIIIDDGSHRSSDIIKSFALYFPSLAEGGVFIAEDLHCSYWRQFEGGLFDPYSSMTFFKRLADIINHEHWGIPRANGDILSGLFAKYGREIDDDVLSQVHSVEFINSMCVVRKSQSVNNRLGSRFIAGSTELVASGHQQLHDCVYSNDMTYDQSRNPWTARSTPPDEAIEQTELALAEAQQQIANLNQGIDSLSQVSASLSQVVAERDVQIAAVYNSLSWRISRPLRFVAHQMGRLWGFADLVISAIRQAGGINEACQKTWKVYQSEGLQGIKQVFKLVAGAPLPQAAKDIDPAYLRRVSRPAEQWLAARVLIVAEMSIPQCRKYRVQQKQEMFKSLGVDCTVRNWIDTQACLDELQTHSLVIFYRVPAHPSVVSMINEARRLLIPTIWEVDDLIFDRGVLANSKALAVLDANTRSQLLEGADLYRNAMLLCDRGVTSTAVLADSMRQAGMPHVHVIENALDRQTLDVASKVCHEQESRQNGIVRIVYGSGTNTHDVDFEVAAPAIIKVLKNFPTVRFRLIGTLHLPPMFSDYESQVERLPLCTYEEYLASLAECQISIAPLENYVFNDAKSNIKYLEASVVRVPSVCSPRDAFVRVIDHGVNGFLCETVDEWEASLALLVTDSAQRAEIGAAANTTVVNHYSPEIISKQQVLPLLALFQRNSNTLRILCVNCYYSPRSYGGATIVAEELNKRINACDGFEVHAFTSVPSFVTGRYSTQRYEADGINVYGMALPDRLDEKEQFENAQCTEAFASVLAVVQPDIVHFHSIQGIGVSVLDQCIQRGINYVVTLHDAWWLCGRQFMINRAGDYCGQEKIDLQVCAKCVDNNKLNLYRSERLAAALQNASALLAPSRYFADFYIANGFANVLVNKNGVVKPSKTLRFRRSESLRFGYVGGITKIKGFHLIKKVFSDLAGVNVKLVLVDNTLSIGFSSYDQQHLAGIPNVEVVPAYTQDTIDDFFARIDVLLFPTQWKESFGLTVREALARNVWVIATDAGGVVEDIVPGRNGYIIPFRDTGQALKQAVTDTLAHYDSISPGDKISLGATDITFFEDQAAELAALFRKVAATDSLGTTRNG